MDLDDMEDMLFGLDASHDSFEIFGSDVSDDEILDDELLDNANDSETNLWDLEDDPFPTPVRTDCTVEQSQIDTQHEVHDSVDMARLPRDRVWVIARIEAMLERIVDGLLEESAALTITLKSRASLSRRRAKGGKQGGHLPEPKLRDINFPGATAQEAWNFTVLLRVLELVHGGLIDNTIMTKRDIYYRHPDLFMKQTIVDRYVDDLACTLGITRSQLNVTTAAKGLVAGNFRIMRQDGHIIDSLKEKEGLLIPKVGEHDAIELASIQWILVIEKEATYRSLLSTTLWETLGLHGLVLTAKGYPDLASRTFLRHIADEIPRVPIFALVDLDPDGIAILSTYKYGSYRLAHEDAPGLSLPQIHWLGVKRHQISRAQEGEGDLDESVSSELQGLMKLTPRDRAKAMRMLEWDLCAEGGLEQAWRHELQTMLMLNTKAEMQVLDELPGGLVSWLDRELGRCSIGDAVESPGPDDGMLF